VLDEHRAARRAAPTIESTRSRVASCTTRWSRRASSTLYSRVVRWARSASRTEARGGTVGPPLSVLLPPRLQEGRGEAPPCEGLGMKAWAMRPTKRETTPVVGSCQRHSHAFVRDLNPSGQHQFGDVTQAHAEAVVEPHAPTDDLRREAIAFVERWSGRRLRDGGIRADRKRLDNAQVPGNHGASAREGRASASYLTRSSNIRSWALRSNCDHMTTVPSRTAEKPVAVGMT
jgi:hypothetical protein